MSWRGRLEGPLLRLYRHLPRRVRLAIVHTVAPGYSVGALAAIERDDGALLFVEVLQRGRWGLPGGLVRRGEHPADAVVREALEEVGVAIEVVGAPAVVVDPGPRRVDVVHRARIVGDGEPHPASPEVVRCAWHLPDDLPPLSPEAAAALLAVQRLREP